MSCFQVGGPSDLLSFLGEAVEQAPLLIWFIGWGPKSCQTANYTPWSERITDSTLLMGRASSKDLCSGIATRRNEICQNLNVGCCKPFPLLHLCLITRVKPTDFLQ